ncbi:DUF1462 family protein [Bacillus lacus]|uniref:DUF1462 family protein n=1 Tax=Metabacillus lacus TaxID=1983721 RepID=A0A7X2J0J0_9BACI|nr:YuzD family protein [Metabacillus lacus]MRX73217.1 DUF1462 family protein [Metabacillus lacus]
MKQEIEVCVYGAEILCPSCVNLPSSKETFEWLEAALQRKYPDQLFTMLYIDIQQPPKDPQQKDICERIMKDEFFYPLVSVEGAIVGEGNPKLKRVYEEVEKHRSEVQSI